MAIKFKHGGREWIADTVDEAIALRAKLESNDQAAIEEGEEPDWITENVWTPDNALELLKAVGLQQKRFLKLMFEGGQVSSPEVMKQLKLGTPLVLAGVLSGLSKQLKKLGVKPWDLYTTQVEWVGKEKDRTFRLSSGFRWAAGEIGWPEKWV